LVNCDDCPDGRRLTTVMRDPKERYQTAGAFRNALAKLEGELKGRLPNFCTTRISPPRKKCFRFAEQSRRQRPCTILDELNRFVR
jgi:hypothetical protein